MGLFLRGLAIGFSIAAPVGPIGVLCIRRSIAHGRRAGLASGLGAATADAAYGAVAALGVTAVTRALTENTTALRIVGGLFLLALGARTFLSSPSIGGTKATSGYLATFALTLTNPTTILSFAAVFAGLGIGAETAGVGSGLLLVAGVFGGSAAWWMILSTGAAALGKRFGETQLRVVNRVSGVIITGFGLLALFAAL